MTSHTPDSVTHAARSKLSSGVLTGVLGFGLAFAVLQALLMMWVMNPDPFIYGQAAKLWLAGERLYAGAWQDRPPVAMMFYALPQMVWPGSYLALCMWLAVWVGGQCLIVALVSGDRHGGAVLAMALLAAMPFLFWDCWWPSTEHVANLFALVLLLTGWRIERQRRCPRAWAMLVGAAAVLALHSRQTAALFALAPLVALLTLKLDRVALGRALGQMLLGVALTWGALLLLLTLTADLRGYVDVTFAYPLRFAAQDMGQSRWELVAVIAVTPLFAIAAMLVAWAHAGPHRVYAWTILVVGLAACLASSRNHTHYWVQLFPVLAVLALVGSEGDSRTGPTPRRMLLAATIVAGLGGPLAFYHSARSSGAVPAGPALHEVAAAIDAVAQPDDTLFVVGPMPADLIFFASTVRPAHRFYCAWQIERPRGDLLPMTPQAIADDYVHAPPTLLALHDDSAIRVRNAIQLPNQPPLPEGHEVVRRLVTAHRYDPIQQINGYTLFRRMP